MRKFVLTAITFCLMAVAAQAQITKGAVLLGGNISGGSSTQTISGSDREYKQSAFSIAPSLGFVTADDKVWGFTLSTGLQKLNGPGQTAQNQFNNYGGAVFHRRYLTLGKGFYLFGQAAAGYGYSKHKYVTEDNMLSRTTRTDNVYLSVYPGVTFIVSKNFHLEAGLNELLNVSYSAQNETTVSGGAASATKTKGLNFGTAFSSTNPLNIGFRFVL